MRRVLIPQAIAAPPRPPHAGPVARLTGETMGTRWTVKLAGAAPPLETLRQDIQRLLDGVVAEMSPWIADSDISAFNRGAAGTWHELPDDFAAVLDCALAIAELSRGAYDPTVGALVELWGFGPGGRKSAPPDEATIARARAQGGWRRLHRQGKKRVRQPGGLQLDLSSIAKGFAVDRVAEELDRTGIADYLIDVGGELRGRGVKPDGLPWWVAIEALQDPRLAAALPQTVVALHGLSVATSGDGQRYFEHDGGRLSHILDPRTGKPVRNDVASVTVLHGSCMTADAWATALMVLGADEGLALARAQNLAALFWVRGKAAWDERMTLGLAAMLD